MTNKLAAFFQLDANQTTLSTEIMAGISTFFAMSYIIFVNPAILSQTGMPYQGVFLATLFASGIATLFIGLYANVPYALAPGMGLNAFFTFTVVMGLGFTWQEALAMVFICGLVNIAITVTNIRRVIISAIPESIQHAISGGIGVFIAYIGVKSANLIHFQADAAAITQINGAPYDASQQVYEGGVQAFASNGSTLPQIASFTEPSTLLALFGLVLTVILMAKNIQGAILIGIVATTALQLMINPSLIQSIDFAQAGLANSFKELGITFGAAFGSEGLLSLFSDPSRLPLVLVTIFAFSLSDIFDTIGTFIGTGRATGIFSKEDIDNLDTRSNTKLDKALFGDVVGTSMGAIFGTSNTTVFAESSVGIAAGGRTGLTSLATGICFFLCIFIAPFIGLVPASATAPALILVGVLMMSSFREVEWGDFSIAVPAFFASIFMAYSYSISNGIAAGFIFYCLTMTVTKRAKEVHPVISGASILFILNYIIMAYL
ncbi:guanine permease [Aerococcus sp. HMSC072A12]|nr:guanine permease [Aerococcus sp. HMSC072A12]